MFFDFYILSNFLQIKKYIKKLNKHLNSHSTDVDFIIHLAIQEESKQNIDENHSIHLLIQLKESLYQRANECLQNPNFKQLPISQIFHILSKSSEKICGDLLYSFINQSIEKFYIL